MRESALLEVAVQAAHGERPEEVAEEWVRRLALQDGVRVAVAVETTPTRPRRFVAYGGQITSPQHYAAIAIMRPLEDVLRGEPRAMDAWEILLAARRRCSPVAEVPMATISRAARLLAREGRLRHGSRPDTWLLPREDEAAA